jgi:hypothetical protein
LGQRQLRSVNRAENNAVSAEEQVHCGWTNKAPTKCSVLFNKISDRSVEGRIKQCIPFEAIIPNENMIIRLVLGKQN